MRKTIFKISVALFAFLFAMEVSAQSVSSIRINEVLVENTNSYMDDYGHRSGWIELHNTGFSSVNLAGNYLSIKRGDKTLTYKIPKNDPGTIIPPQGYAVFFADGIANKGTFYTNFTLDQTGDIFLLDAGGRGPAIDSVHYSLDNLKENVSLGWVVETPNGDPIWKELSSTTPGATNNVVEFQSRSETFRLEDPIGITMSLTAMSVVFVALIVLYQVFRIVGKSMVRIASKKEIAAKGGAVTAENIKKAGSADNVMSGEIASAIALAIYLYEEDLHDQENTVLTINRVARVYSPWSSKIYGINNQPEKVRK